MRAAPALATAACAAGVGSTLYADQKARSKLLRIVSHRQWLLGFAAIAAFVVLVSWYASKRSKESEHMVESLKKAILALVISMYADAGMTQAPFWSVFLLAHFFTGWI